ncbi:MAG: hypothetical protein Q9212_004443 [Teloschistes hypoglaucus]
MADSIRFWHHSCYNAFIALGQALDQNTADEADFSQEDFIDLFGRFNVWADNIGAGQQGRASLDYRLREASNYREVVMQNLRYLLKALNDVTSIVSGEKQPVDELSSDSDSSDSLSSLDDESHDTDAVPQLSDWTELEQLQISINTFISSLYRVSVIIRENHKPFDRLVKCAKIDVSFYEFFDERHVLEKYPDAAAALIQRLGEANSKRRQYFKYRQQHREKLSQPPSLQNSGIPDHDARKTDHTTFDEVRAVSNNGGAHPPPGVQEHSTTQLGSTKGSTIATSFHPPVEVPPPLEVVDQISEVGTHTSYGTTTSVQIDKVAVPPAPASAINGREFECPYCYTICRLSPSDSRQRQKQWKRHVLRDLQPYVCTFGGCSEANTLFERRRDWIAHELRAHRIEWFCNTPGHQPHGGREEFQNHLRLHHADSFGPDQLDTLTTMMRRPGYNLKFTCPLCPSEPFQNFSIDRIEKHLGRHLEVIATFALPLGVPESEASQDSVVAQDENSNDRGSSMAKDISSEVDSLDDPSGKEHSQSSDEISENELVNLSEHTDEDWAFLRRQDVPSSVSLSQVGGNPEAAMITEICDWLASDGQSKMFAAINALKHPSTGSWFFESEGYKKLKGGAISILLVQGLPVCGKTVLASAVIEQLIQESVLHAFYFFERESVARTSIDVVIRALIAQLVRRAKQMPPALYQLFQAFHREIMSPTIEQLLDVLSTLFSLFEETYLVLDGLDLVSDEMTNTFARIIKSAFMCQQNVRLLATSRINSVVEGAILLGPLSRSIDGVQWRGRFQSFIIPRKFTDNDIQIVLESKIRERERVEVVTRESNGIFTWALVNLEITKRYSLIKHRLDRFKAPGMVTRAMKELWEGILGRVLAQASAEEIGSAIQVLQLLSVCERQLNADEMHESLSYDVETHTWGHGTYSDRYEIWRALPALLELTGQPQDDREWSENLGLVHSSLRDFLLSDWIRRSTVADFAVKEMQAQRMMARKCVSHLTRYSRSDLYYSKYGWTAYAGRYWHVHIRKLDSDSYLVSECMGLLHHRSPAFAHWTSLNRWQDEEHKMEKKDFARNDVYPSPLYYAALLGLRGVAKSLLEEDAEVNIAGGRYGSPILAAVVGGEGKLVGLLLQHGADANSRLATEDKGGTAIHLAVEWGKAECLQMLLNAGADMEVRNDDGERALHLAAKQDKVELARLLLQRGANVNSPTLDEQCHTALSIAVERLNVPLVELLLAYTATGRPTYPLDLHGMLLHLAVSAFSEAVSRSGNRTNEYLEELVNRTEKVLASLLDHGAVWHPHPESAVVEAMLPNWRRLLNSSC